MAKKMVYFNATKQIETIAIHYNNKLDGAFVEDVCGYIKEVSKKMSKIDLKNPKEFYTIQVFVYPSRNLFNKVFSGEIEKRFYSRRRSLEDLYVVRDSEGNIHIVSPRGMGTEKVEAFKKILVMKILGEYMEEKEKQSAERLLKEAMHPKEEEKEEEHAEQDPEEEELEEKEEEIDPEEIEDEIDEEEFDEILETEKSMEQVDEKLEEEEKLKKTKEKKKVKSEAQEWLSVGWLYYVKGRLKKPEDVKKFANNISKKGIKKLSGLSNTRMLESYNYSPEYACAWVEYIVCTYGMKKLQAHYENPKDIKGVFGVPKVVFENQLKAYVKSKYKNNEKVLKITEDIKLDNILTGSEEREKEPQNAIDEIQVVHLTKSGGAEIDELEEIKEIDAKEIV